MRKIATFVFLLATTSSFAQTTNLATLPTYDCSLKKIMAILGRQTVIATPNNSKGLETILTDYCNTFGSNCILKKESGLTTNDYAKDILMVGVLSDFKNWNKLQLPIKKLAGGFLINNKIFNDKSDGFVLLTQPGLLSVATALKLLKMHNWRLQADTTF